MRISIHAPHEGERPHKYYDGASPCEFQSTLPTRGSDPPAKSASTMTKIFQSTLPTRGSDWEVNKMHTYELIISIHAPHEGERL